LTYLCLEGIYNRVGEEEDRAGGQGILSFLQAVRQQIHHFRGLEVDRSASFCSGKNQLGEMHEGKVVWLGKSFIYFPAFLQGGGNYLYC